MKIKINKEAFKLAILTSGLSISEIAEKSNLSRYTIYRILNTSCTVNSSTVGRLARTLDVEVVSIIENN